MAKSAAFGVLHLGIAFGVGFAPTGGGRAVIRPPPCPQACRCSKLKAQFQGAVA